MIKKKSKDRDRDRDREMEKKDNNEISDEQKETKEDSVTFSEQGNDENANDNASSDEEDPLNLARKALEEMNDKYLRLYSEFDNYRKRTIKERAELLDTATSGLITQLLPILDDFERAIDSFSNKNDQIDSSVKEGVELIYQKFKKTLEQKGLKPIDPVGEMFNTDVHEAVTNIPAPSDDMKGKVIEVIEKGYLLNGKVLRFAKVAVAG